MWGCASAAARDTPGEGSALAIPVMPRAGLETRTSPWVWWGNEHVSSLTSLLISQHKGEGDWHQSQPASKANTHPPPCFYLAVETGHGEGRDKAQHKRTKHHG